MSACVKSPVGGHPLLAQARLRGVDRRVIERVQRGDDLGFPSEVARSMACRSARPSISHRAIVRSVRSSTESGHDPEAELRFAHDEALLDEALQTLADRAHAAAVAFGQLGKGQARTRTKLAAQDVAAELACTPARFRVDPARHRAH